MKINRLNVKGITYYGYRTAKVKKIITLDRNSEDGVELERWLNNTTNNTLDNHVCFNSEDKGGGHLYVMVTVGCIHLVTTIIVGSW